MTVSRRQMLQIAAVAALPAPALAQTFPSRAIRVIVPVTAGGPTDVIGRIVAQKLAELIGQPCPVENIPAGATNVGMATAARAQPDGHTILFVTSSLVTNPSIFAKLPFDAVKDLAPVTLAATSPFVAVVPPSLGVKTMKEFVDLVKANPGKYSYGSPGIGQLGHLSVELIKAALGLDLVHVPFNGAAPAIQATMGGHVHMTFPAVGGVAPAVVGGKLVGLAVASGKRSVALPDVPTLAEAGFPGHEYALLQGVMVPAATPRPIVDKLHAEIVKAVTTPEIKARLEGLGFEIVASSSDQFAGVIKVELARWAKAVKDAGIKPIE